MIKEDRSRQKSFPTPRQGNGLTPVVHCISSAENLDMTEFDEKREIFAFEADPM
jgi:hypothetical protein